jgi:hemerythrin-like metal-binding protein
MRWSICFNELSQTFYSTDRRREEVLTDTFARLVAYTEYHFSDEEALMQGVGIDPRHKAAHKAQHAQFVEQIKAIWSVRETLPNAAESIVGFLTSWLGLHILGTDQSLARQIVAIAAGGHTRAGLGERGKFRPPATAPRRCSR